MENNQVTLSVDGSQPKNDDTNSHFLESLRPLTQFMNLIGFPIPKTWFKYMYRYLCLFWVWSIHLAINVHIWFNLESVSSTYSPNTSSTALSLNYLIDTINFSISTISVHIFFLMATRTSTWKTLIDSFQLSISPQLYAKCRRASWIAIVCAAIMDLTMEILLAVAVIPNKISAARKILDLLCFPTRLYQSAPFVLFCVLALAASWQLEYIHTRIERLRFLNAHVDKAKNLKLLMREHVHICRSIQIFNNFFGFFLFVEVVFIFVGIINASMFVLVSSLIGHFDLAFVNGAIATDQFVRLFVMSYVSSAITKKNTEIYNALMELAQQSPSLENVVEVFAKQIFRFNLRIDAFGFFGINMQLLPKVIGTTLTYFLIMLQFHSNETLQNKRLSGVVCNHSFHRQ